MYKYIFNNIKKLIPKISNTELIALRTGGVSIDSDIFKGIFNLPEKVITQNKVIKNDINKMISNNIDFNFPTNYENGMKDLASNKVFGYIIDDKYGGNKLSVNELSRTLTHITSGNPALGVCAMVPNSLGPGELLQKYGTEEQKNKYLSGLSDGKYIPCFGLTGPNNGSDATGDIDKGILRKENGEYFIDLTINKRYITLAPIANLIGIAFELKDPNKYGYSGICLALVERGHLGLEQSTYHNPLDVGFPNGTLKGTIKLNFNDIIGGEKQIGNGWQMLMECLAAGRAVSLPACANASSKVSAVNIYNYINHRKQFKMPLIKMEGVKQKYMNILYHTWVINSSIHMTNNILDGGVEPSVISAIMKQQTTERGRIVVNDAMDIYAGSGIIKGKNNFLEKFYKSSPVGITVEGSNTLTRNLMIFGQGLNKSHPFISKIFDDIQSNDLTSFKSNFNGYLSHIVSNYINTIFSLNYRNVKYKHCLDTISDTYNMSNKTFILNTSIANRISKQLAIFSTLSNFISLKGGAIKREQNLSGDMADLLSNLYLIKSVIWYEKYNCVSNKLCLYSVNRLLNENQYTINRIVDNMNYKLLFRHFKELPNENYNIKYMDSIINDMKYNKRIMEHLKEDIYMDNIAMKLDYLNKVEPVKYNSLYNDVINVGENLL